MAVLFPKSSGQFIAVNSKHVKINLEGVENLAVHALEQLYAGNIKIQSVCEHECCPSNVSDEVAIDWLFLIDSINFCFWLPNSPHWEVYWRGKTYTGYFALCAAIARAINDGMDLTNPKVYSKLTFEELAHILRGKAGKHLPLLQERLDCLHEVGKVLLDKYEGSFANCVKACEKSANKLVLLITTDFPSYRDEATYCGMKVSFYKRAQIMIADIWSHFGGEGYGEFVDMDTITMFADYRVPQVLVYFGALTYTDELMKVLKSGKILENGCNYEVEIRGCSIDVIERVKEQVQAWMKRDGVQHMFNSTLLDNYLWLYRRKNARQLDAIPFHKVQNIYY